MFTNSSFVKTSDWKSALSISSFLTYEISFITWPISSSSSAFSTFKLFKIPLSAILFVFSSKILFKLTPSNFLKILKKTAWNVPKVTLFILKSLHMLKALFFISIDDAFVKLIAKILVGGIPSFITILTIL